MLGIAGGLMGLVSGEGGWSVYGACMQVLALLKVAAG